jgi:Ca2+-binding RTX toxin-like protein
MDLICGGDGNDTLIVNSGYADVEGGAGDNRIQASRGTFTQVDYGSSPAPVNVDLGVGTASGWGNDVLVNVTAVWGSPFDDTVTGTARSDWIFGGAGNDTIATFAGSDYLRGGPGDDRLDGGTGQDWIDYIGAAAGVRVSLAKGTAIGGAGHDTLHSVERAQGSRHADVLVGSAGPNALYGASGNDKLYGGKGKDVLDGAEGKDRADGGPARDECFAERKVHCP